MLKRITVIAAICLMVITFACCSGDDPLKDFSNDCGVDLSGGKIVSEEDNHGGFHGDGFSLLIADYSNDTSVLEAIATSEIWHQLPLSENLATFVYQPYDDALMIPQIENGYYYFYDRHNEAADPFDGSELLKRYSFNFTLAIYDSDANMLYLCEYDT